MGKRSFIRCYPEIQRMGTCVMTTASDVSDSNGGENIWKERAAANGLAKLWNRKLILRDFF